MTGGRLLPPGRVVLADAEVFEGNGRTLRLSCWPTTLMGYRPHSNSPARRFGALRQPLLAVSGQVLMAANAPGSRPPRPALALLTYERSGYPETLGVVNMQPDMRAARAAAHPELRQRRGDYGFDGSLVRLCVIGAAGAVLAGLAGVHRRAGRRRLSALYMSRALVLLATVASYLHTTRRGKFVVWAELLGGLRLRGDERVLDMGCGRGAVLTMVAKLTPHGQAIGLDLWTADQSGNRPAATLWNLRAEGVSGHCALVTGDMAAVPFSADSFDVVLSSLAVHNIDRSHWRSAGRRLQAVDEAVRVLKPGHRLMIVDLAWASAYAKHLAGLGMEHVQCRSLGWRFWYGPWAGAKLVTATKP